MSEDEALIKKMEESAEVLTHLIETTIKDSEKRESLSAMFDKIGTNYLMSPASRRESYHNSFYGGLFEHSMNVYGALLKANEAFDLKFTDEEMLTVALLHDIGKCVAPNLEDPHYKDSEDWMKKKMKQAFEPDYDSGYFTNRDRTMFVLQHFKIKLTPQEWQSVLLNDGLIIDANRAYALKEYDLAYWTQVCDNWSTRCENPQPHSNQIRKAG